MVQRYEDLQNSAEYTLPQAARILGLETRALKELAAKGRILITEEGNLSYDSFCHLEAFIVPLNKKYSTEKETTELIGKRSLKKLLQRSSLKEHRMLETAFYLRSDVLKAKKKLDRPVVKPRKQFPVLATNPCSDTSIEWLIEKAELPVEQILNSNALFRRAKRLFQCLDQDVQQVVALLSEGKSHVWTRESLGCAQCTTFDLARRAKGFAKKWFLLPTSHDDSQTVMLCLATERLKHKPKWAAAYFEYATDGHSDAELELNSALDLLKRYYILDDKGWPTQETELQVKKQKKSSPVLHQVYRWLSDRTDSKDRIAGHKLRDLACKYYKQDGLDRESAFRRFWSNIVGLIDSGWIKKQKINGIVYYVLNKQSQGFFNSEPPPPSSYKWSRTEVTEFCVWKSRWINRRMIAEHIIKATFCPNGLSLDEPRRFSMKEQIRTALTATHSIPRDEIEPNLVTRVYDYCVDDIFIRDKSEVVKWTNAYSLGMKGLEMAKSIFFDASANN